MPQCYSIIIDGGIRGLKDVKDVVDWLNDVDKRYIYIYQLMPTVQFPGSNRFDSQMQMHTSNQKYDVSLAKKFQHYLINSTAKTVCLLRPKTINDSWKENGKTDSIMFNIIMMLRTKMWECIVTQINYQN